MPEPNHNYVLSNGIVTHNSHTVSYSVISYWCAWMKRYHPLEYFAASLRNAKDEKQAYEILREVHEEGYGYVPFDIDRSGVDWSVIDGELIGGFQNLHGFGPSKAVKAVEDRRLGKLDADKIKKAEVKFLHLYPLHVNYGHVYGDPQSVGVRAGDSFTCFQHLPAKGEVLVLAEVVRKELRDENETVRVARRDGRRLKGQTLFLDVFATDDSGIPMTLRFDRFIFQQLGQKAADRLKPGDVVMVRGYKIQNFAMIKVKKVKCLNRPEVFD